MKNTFGNALGLTIFGESHGAAVGAVLDGLAAGLPVDEAYIAEPSGWTAAAPAEMGFPPPAPSRMWWSF